MNSIIIGGRVFFFNILRKPIRSIRLHLKSRDSFSISCPLLTPDFILKKFITDNSGWIIKNSDKVSPKTRLSDLTHLVILGQKYQIGINSSQIRSVKIDHLNFIIYLKNYSALKTALKPLAKKIIQSELSNLSAQFNFTYNRLSLRNQKTRFGSCSSRGNLNFNWQIIFFPPALFRHVLLHEAAHLTHHNHSHKFWELLTFYDPQTKVNNLWLKKEGSRYFIISP